MSSETTPLLTRETQPERRAPWDPKRGYFAGAIILVTLTLERLAFYALVANLFIFLSVGLSWSPRAAIIAVLILVGIAHFSALFGGWLADALLGRYWTLVVGLSLYVIGYILLTVTAKFLICSASEDEEPACVLQMYGILLCIGTAAGTVRANFPSFGAEQVKYGGPESLRQFFNWYYWCVNTGSLLGVGALSYVALDLKDGFFKAFAGTCGCLCVALVLFAAGRSYYLIHRPAGSVLWNIVCIVKEAIEGRCSLRQSGSIQSSPVIGRRSGPPPATPTWLDYAKISYGGNHHDSAVEDIKSLGAILVLFACLLPYWLVFFQVETGFQEQGVHLQISFSGGTFNLPTAWLGLFDQIFILALIPLMNGVVYPCLDRLGCNVGLLTRMVIGMFLSFLAVMLAGFLEFWSLKRWSEGYMITQVIHNVSYNASDLPLFWQIPQYCLVGTAEVFAGVAGLEYAYSAAPRPLQGVAMGMFAAVEGVGSLLGTVLISALSPVWIRRDAEHFMGHLDYYFFLLAGIQGVAVILFSAWLLVRRRRRQVAGAQAASTSISS